MTATSGLLAGQTMSSTLLDIASVRYVYRNTLYLILKKENKQNY